MSSRLLQNIFFYLLHALVFLAFALMIYTSTGELAVMRKAPFGVALMVTVMSMGSYYGLIYVVYFVFLPQYLVSGQYKKFFLYLLTILTLYPVFYYALGRLFTLLTGINERLLSNIPLDGLLGLTLLAIVLASLFRIFIQWFRDAYDKAELEKQQLKGELDHLKNQLNPHFLFNSLNNIDALIHAQSPHASLALNKLSGMMRYMVYDSEKERVSLAEEIHYIENYIALQRLRLVDDSILQFQIHGEVHEQQIAPMIFISFVENAFKHASLKAGAPPIKITFELKNDQLLFRCCNAIAEKQKDESSGIGLENVIKRLNLIYKHSHALEIDQNNGFFNVRLEIQLT